MKKFLLSLSIIALIAVSWLAFEHFRVQEVTLVSPQYGQAVKAVYATGTVEATVMMPIASRISARLQELKVDEGSEVTKDQVLAQLEDEDTQQNLQEKRAREMQARQTYQRYAELVKRGAISKDAYDRAHADWDATQAARKMAEAQSKFTRLTSPADGRIIRRDGEIGQLIPANQPVFWLSCCAPLRISAEVDEEDISAVQPGQKVLIRADAFPGEVYSGKVQAITPKGDPIARSYRVRVEFTETNPLMIGMTAETNIILSEKADALLLPNSALMGNSVWQVNDGKLAKTAVKLGAKGKETTEVLEGISEKDKVVLAPQAEWKDGQAVRIK